MLIKFKKILSSAFSQYQQPSYYKDNIIERDELLKQIYEEIDSGTPWIESVKNPKAIKHGERIIEYAKIASTIKKISNTSSIIDIGCVMNNPIINYRVPDESKIHFLNPSIENILYPEYSYHKMPLSSWSLDLKFDLVTCLSTIEHIGFDNTRYGVQETDKGWDWANCIDEVVKSIEKLLSMTKKRGTMITSCPYGQKEFVLHPPDVGVRTAQVLHMEHVLALSEQPFSKQLKISTFRLDKQGWSHCAPDGNFASYGTIGPGASGIIFIEGKGL